MSIANCNKSLHLISKSKYVLGSLHVSFENYKNGNRRSYGNKGELIHGSGGRGNMASSVGGEVVGWHLWREVKIEKRVTDWVAEGVVNGAATLVPDRAFIERNRFSVKGGRGGGRA